MSLSYRYFARVIVTQGFEFVNKNKRQYRRLFLEASPRLELGVRILQTLALPLGYDAISCIGDADTLCGAGDGVAIFDGDLAERTRAGLRILRSSLRETESRPHDIMKNSTSCEMLFFGGITQT